MAESVLYGIAQEVLKNLGSTALNEIASAWGFKAHLEKLKNTINTLKDVLLDAEDKQAESRAVRGWLERLTTAVYAADDLFDEFATVAARKQLIGGNKVTREVQTFFSRSNQIALAFNISHKIKEIRKELDDIVMDSSQFASLLPRLEERVVLRRDQTCSFLDVDEVIGRHNDKKIILDILLGVTSSSADAHEHEHQALPVIPIVGIGGMGKTALAQLIFNDPQVDKLFELKMWVCVSENFDIKEITEKILKSMADAKTTTNHKLEMEQLLCQLRREVSDKKYLLALDDVWNEDREEWLKLKALLKIIGRKGSKVLATTRSKEVAKIMATLPTYELDGLSEVNSWVLFEKMAFEPGQSQQKPHLVKVGKEIVRKCANVTLAIKTVGSLLYGKDEKRWLLLKDEGLASISQKQNSIVKILKLSYHDLWSPLKICFAYRALFPKDFVLHKLLLMNLWMAEGFLLFQQIMKARV